MKLRKGAKVDVYSTHCEGSHVGEVVESPREGVVHLMLRVDRRDGPSCGLDDTLNQSTQGHLLREVAVLVSPSQEDIDRALTFAPFVAVAKVALSAPGNHSKFPNSSPVTKPKPEGDAT